MSPEVLPAPGDQVRQLCDEKHAAERKVSDLECLFAWLVGGQPDVMLPLLRKVAAGDDDWAAPTATALLKKLKK